MVIVLDSPLPGRTTLALASRGRGPCARYEIFDRRGMTMAARAWALTGLLALTAGVAAAQLAPGYVDPRPVLEAAGKAIGADQLRCVTVSGTAYAGMVGQQREAGWNVDWPRGEPLAGYTRTMNWEAKTMREEFDRK